MVKKVDKEIRYIVVWDSTDGQFYIDEEMAHMVFNGDDVWLPDEVEWDSLDEHEADYQVARDSLIERLGAN